jgi:prepilin-type N-terminal cleavage/methylation domain-containing protein
MLLQSSKSMMNSSRSTGFTLLELLIVMVIIGLAAGVGVANFRDFGRRQEIDNYARTLNGELRTVHADASGGKRVTGCTGTFQGYAIDFAASATGGGSRSTAYTVSAVCATASVIVKTVTLPSSVFLLINRVPSAGNVRLLFKPLELGTDVTPANSLTFTVSSSQVSQTKTISVTASGEIQ